MHPFCCSCQAEGDDVLCTTADIAERLHVNLELGQSMAHVAFIPSSAVASEGRGILMCLAPFKSGQTLESTPARRAPRVCCHTMCLDCASLHRKALICPCCLRRSLSGSRFDEEHVQIKPYDPSKFVLREAPRAASPERRLPPGVDSSEEAESRSCSPCSPPRRPRSRLER